MQKQIERARQLAKERRYDEARKLLAGIDHPRRDEWLAQIDMLERRNRADAAQPATQVRTSSRKSAKPLPLLPEEERKVLKGGKPRNPREILTERYQLRGSARAFAFLFGGKSGPLILNYFRMSRPVLGVSFFLVYVILFIAWTPCFAFTFILGQRLLQTGDTHFPVLILCLAVTIMLPFLPNIIAWVQQEHYEAWVREYAKLREDYLSRQS